MHKKYDVIIIGAGPAGIFGTFFSVFNGLKVLLLENDSEIGGKPIKFYPNKPIYDFPGFASITGEELINNFIKQLNTVSKEKYDILTNIDICDIEKKDDLFKLTDLNKNIYNCKYLILSFGFSSFKFKTINEDKIKTKNKIKYFINDKEEFINKKISIFGGGDSAADYANFLSKNNKVNLIHHSSDFKCNISSQESFLNNDSINIYKDYAIDYIDDNKIFLICNNNKKKKSLEYDHLLVFYGVELLKNNLLKSKVLNGKVKIDVKDNNESHCTENMYAAGNVVNKKRKDTILTAVNDILNIVDDIARKEKNK